MGKYKNFSFSAFGERFGQTFKRFPLAMLLVLFVTCFLIFLDHGGEVSDRWEFFLRFYPVTGAMLAVALSLFTEDFMSRPAAVAVQAVIHAAWLGISAYLTQIERFSLPEIIAVGATLVAIGLAIFLISFYRKNQDLPFWYFSMRTIIAAVVSVAIGGALTIGLELLAESFRILFGFDVGQAVNIDIWVVCMGLLSPVLWMLLIPKGEQKFLYEAPAFSRFAKGVVQYLFLPMLGLYLITLYVYAAKILLQWTLPVGGVSYLVSGSMVLMVLLIYVTYPLQHQEGNRLFKRVTRWLPVVMLPLLALMTVAIARRLSDYGITVSRLYLLVFNLWCYAVCLWLIFTRNKRIWLIPASFAVILFLISVGPQSIANVTRSHLLKEARTAMMASGIKHFPLSGDQYKQWLDQTDDKVAEAIDSKLDYLLCEYSSKDICGLVDDAAAVGYYRFDKENEVKGARLVTEYSNSNLINHVAVPQGYTTMTDVNTDCSTFSIKGDKILLELSSPDLKGKYHFVIDFKQLERFHIEGYEPNGESLVLEGNNALLMLDDFELRRYSDGEDTFVWTGILFTK